MESKNGMSQDLKELILQWRARMQAVNCSQGRAHAVSLTCTALLSRPQ